MDKLLLKPKEAFEVIGVCRSVGYAMIASGMLPSIKLGRSIRIPVSALQEWVTNKLTGANPETTSN